MRVLIKFEKTGAAAYASHLDLMRTVQRTLNRAALPILYSNGFNPHPVLSFAQALSLGQESVGEYMEAGFADDTDLSRIVPAFNEAAPMGVRALSVRAMRKEEPSAMAAVVAASYRIWVEESCADAVREGVRIFQEKEQHMYDKKSKAGIKQVDMRKQVLAARAEGNTVTVLLSCGNDNLRPDVYMQEVCKLGGIQPCGVRIVRTELFTLREGALLPLSEG